jgi:hypothetical protein
MVVKPTRRLFVMVVSESSTRYGSCFGTTSMELSKCGDTFHVTTARTLSVDASMGAISIDRERIVAKSAVGISASTLQQLAAVNTHHILKSPLPAS